MDELRYTPGIWIFDPGDEGDRSVGIGATPPTVVARCGNIRIPICTLEIRAYREDREPIYKFDDCLGMIGDWKANGHLIAAAPDTLRVLRTVADYLAEECDFGAKDREPEYSLWVKAEDAIHKALGG